MHNLRLTRCAPILAAMLSLTAAVPPAAAQGNGAFTVQITGSPAPPSTLVSHDDIWHYRRGTNEPEANWQTLPVASLDATWLTNRGGFGYGDPGIVGENTTLTNMLGVHTTLYLRKTFTVGALADTNLHLRLTVDYDDGFVVFLDGGELTRRNLTNGPGTFVSYRDTTVTSHEASCCNPPTNPAETIDLGAAGNRLLPGDHVLAFIGVNGTLGSSDFHLSADLRMDSGAAPMVEGSFFALVGTNILNLNGSNTLAGSTRVVVNGDEAVFNPAQGTWSKTHALKPGLNRLFIAALDADGAILASTNRDVIAELSTTFAGGTLPANTAWSSGVVRVTNNLVLASGVNLSIGNDVVVLLTPNGGIQAGAGATLTVLGASEQPVFFLPADGATPWQALTATGGGSTMTLQHVEVVAGQVVAGASSVVTVEDSLLRDFHVAGRNLLQGTGGQQLTLRRCHALRYDQNRFAQTPVVIEDCLFEEVFADATDFADQAGIEVRRTTYRFGHGGNTDAIDLGGNTNFVADRCLIHDFPDKGVSVADHSDGMTVRNTLIYRTGSGLSAYATTGCVFENNTVLDSLYGIHLYESTPGQGAGHATATNNILWGNTNAVVLANGATVFISSSDIQDDGGVPGTGNISADPQFVNAAADNYQLAPGSPCLGTGAGGADMGARFPVGGIPSAPSLLAAGGASATQIRLWWREDADNESGFEVERSSDAATWQRIGAAPVGATNFVDASPARDALYYYRVRATNSSGASRFSNIAGARTVPPPQLLVGGTLTSNTVWHAGLGTILVMSNLTVPTNIMLTIQAGVAVKVTNTAAIRALGGVIDIAGEFTNKVVISSFSGTNNWGGLSVSGANAALTIRHADIAGASVKFYTNAAGLIEDSYLHHYYSAGDAIAGSTRAAAVTLRRSHFSYYHETLFQFTRMLVEDCLFENATDVDSDAMDFDAAPAGSIVRRTTFRNGRQTNTDAIDIGSGGGLGSQGTLIYDCLMQSFSDKGVSIGEESYGIVVSNCLMIAVDRGVQVKDVCTATIANCTIVNSGIGIHCYEKFAGTGGGRATNTYNNILWGNGSAITVETNSIIVVHHTDAQGTNWPGTGNFSADPLFVNPAQNDFRVQPGSPCLGTGLDGTDLGMHWPVGAFIQAPTGLVATAVGASITLTWQDNSQTEAAFEIERAVNGPAFAYLITVPAGVTNFLDAGLAPGNTYHYRVRGVSVTSQSEYSNEAAASPGQPPAITQQPQSRVAAPGTDASFVVAATGLDPLTFLWHRDGIVLSGQTNTALVVTNAQTANAGNYFAVVIDAIGQSATSAVARLTIAVPPLLAPVAGVVSSNGGYALQFSAPTNISYVIEASTNLTQWIPLATNTTGGGLIEYIDPSSTNFPYRFYRALLRP